MIEYTICPAWPDELKSLARRLYRCQLRVENLENATAHCDPEYFDSYMVELENAQDILQETAAEYRVAKYKYEGTTLR